MENGDHMPEILSHAEKKIQPMTKFQIQGNIAGLGLRNISSDALKSTSRKDKSSPPNF